MSVFRWSVVLFTLILIIAAPAAVAQGVVGPAIPGSPDELRLLGLDAPMNGSDGAPNPMRMLSAAGGMLPGGGGASGGSSPDGGGLSAALNIMVLLTVITLAPAIVLMTTSFVRILIVLGLLRQALGTQSMPPPQVITSLALMLTMVVMAPTFNRVWDEAMVPWQSGEVRDYDELWAKARQPLRDFMFDQIEACEGWSSVYMLLNHQGIDTSEPENLTRADVSTATLVPAYMLSELKTAFIMGFRVYLPFLVIDIVIATVLISMSMMMLPPVLISLPFKLLLFVMVDGWQLVAGGLIASFTGGGG